MILEMLETIINKNIQNINKTLNIKNSYYKGKIDAYNNVLNDIRHLMNKEVERDAEVIELREKVKKLEEELNDFKTRTSYRDGSTNRDIDFKV